MVLREFCESLKEKHIRRRGEERPIAGSRFVSQHSNNTRFWMGSWTANRVHLWARSNVLPRVFVFSSFPSAKPQT